jgi:hypothetical protein
MSCCLQKELLETRSKNDLKTKINEIVTLFTNENTRISLEELKEMVAEEVGYNEVPKGSSDAGQRSYGTSDDGIIELCFNFLTDVNIKTK